jgi:hypothetical protein
MPKKNVKSARKTARKLRKKYKGSIPRSTMREARKDMIGGLKKNNRAIKKLTKTRRRKAAKNN